MHESGIVMKQFLNGPRKLFIHDLKNNPRLTVVLAMEQGDFLNFSDYWQWEMTKFSGHLNVPQESRYNKYRYSHLDDLMDKLITPHENLLQYRTRGREKVWPLISYECLALT